MASGSAPETSQSLESEIDSVPAKVGKDSENENGIIEDKRSIQPIPVKTSDGYGGVWKYLTGSG